MNIALKSEQDLFLKELVVDKEKCWEEYNHIPTIHELVNSNREVVI